LTSSAAGLRFKPKIINNALHLFVVQRCLQARVRGLDCLPEQVAPQPASAPPE
jgi:hypothetical protein